MARISIIVPIYKAEKYIERCISSVCHQTYSDIECILIDDCSPDRSADVVERMLGSYDGPIHFTFVSNDTNRGCSGTRNRGIDMASGEYIFFLDSDDELSADGIEKLLGLADKYNGVDIVQGNMQTIPHSEKEDWRDVAKKGFPFFVDSNRWCREHFYSIRNKQIPMNMNNKLIRTQFLRDHALYCREGIIHEDDLWMFHAVKHVSSMAFCRDIVYFHYVVPGSIIQSGRHTASLTDWLLIFEEMLGSIDQPLAKQQVYKIIATASIKIEEVVRYGEGKDMFGRYIRLFGDIRRNRYVRLSIWQRLPLLLYKMPYRIISAPLILRLTKSIVYRHYKQLS